MLLGIIKSLFRTFQICKHYLAVAHGFACNHKIITKKYKFTFKIVKHNINISILTAILSLLCIINVPITNSRLQNKLNKKKLFKTKTRLLKHAETIMYQL